MVNEKRIILKTPGEISIIRDAGKILASIIEDLKRSLSVGITTRELDFEAEKLIRKNKVAPAFKGYRGFPACACISVNDEVVHGIPGDRHLKDGDIVSVDVGIIHQGFYSDTALTLPVGKIKPELQRLLDVASHSLMKGIEQAKIGNRLGDISHAVQKFVEGHRFSVVREFVGHGIGRNLHEEPEIPNFGSPRTGPLLKEGMVMAIEPMVNLGGFQTKILSDGWTVVTADGKASAHFEHTIVITNKGPEILTI